MWRSTAKSLLLISSKTLAPPSATRTHLLRSQVLSKTLDPFSFSCTWVILPADFNIKNPRFFSQESDTTFENNIDEVPGNADINPNLFSQESQAPLAFETLDSGAEIPNFFSQEEVVEQREELIEQTPDEPDLEPKPELDIEQVQAVLSVLQSSLDGPLESALDKLDLEISENFLISVIETPQVLGENLVGFFRWASKMSDSSITVSVVEILVRTIGMNRRKKDVYLLWDLLKDIGEKEKGLLNTEILNELISVFWKLGKAKAGLEVFRKFEEFKFEPNADSYYFTIRAICTCYMFEEAWSVCEKMLNSGILPDSEKIGELIACFCKGSKAKDAHLIYLMAKENNKYPPRSSINFLIGSLCQDDETVGLAREILEDFTGESRKYAIKPFSSVVRGLCRIKDLKGANKLLFRMIESGPPPGNAVFNSVINGLSKAGELEKAMELMKFMSTRGLRPDVYAYSVIMSGLVKYDKMDEASKVFSEAKKVHSKLNPVTYHILIRGYCKLEKFEKALELLNEMKDSGVSPNADEYTKLIQSLCLKAMDWRTSEVLLKEMTDNGLYINKITGSLIRAVKELEQEELQSEGVGIEE